MPTLEKIKRPLGGHVARYEELVNDILYCGNEYVSSIYGYVLSKRGKQMRPLLTLLAAALHGKVNRESYMAAAMVEMVHSASLLHDDVIDEAAVRRGAPSVKAVWGSRVAILSGDYILSRTFTRGIEAGCNDIIRVVTASLGEVTEGELIQTEQTEKLSMTEDIYYDIIAKKTAALLGASAEAGAISAGAGEEQRKTMRMFGRYLGIAFQIKDDILDFADPEVTGKPSCGDIKERKITLPLLHVLENGTAGQREKILGILREDAISDENTEYIYRAVVDEGGLEYAEKQMERFGRQAMESLDGYPPSEILDSMKMFAEYVLHREK